MSPRSKREYTEAVHLRYKHATRFLKSFKRFTKPKGKRRGKPCIYQSEAIRTPLKEIWHTANMPCSKRLKVILPLWLPGYVECFGELSPDVVSALLKVSPSTIDRLLKQIPIQYNKRGRATTKPGTLLRKQIPIKTNQWDEFRPGFLEADTVAHCGDSTAGMYFNTVDFVHIATGWTEQRAVWGKGETGILEQIKDIENTLPFPIFGFDSDNG